MRDCGCMWGDSCTKISVCSAQGELDEAVGALEEDARRYRWLRNSRLQDFPPTEFGKGWWETLGGLEDEWFDDAIDKALMHKEPK